MDEANRGERILGDAIGRYLIEAVVYLYRAGNSRRLKTR
jgi:hypothetical protein